MKITITKNGPYVIDPGVPLKEADSVANRLGGISAYEEKQDHGSADSASYLCRCGHSQNKPFCDGHHAKIDFDGTETNNRKNYDDEAEFINGAAYNVLDNSKFCTVARFCDAGKGFWDAVDKADDTSKKYVEHVGRTCNGGRLTLVDKQSGQKLEPKLEKEIYLVKDVPAKHLGPIHVRGGIPVVSFDGFEYEVRNRVALCRCGESRNMPFCDATHMDCTHMEI